MNPTTQLERRILREESRKAFEGFISSPPFERDIMRNPMDETVTAWPRQYCDYTVELCWEVWQEAWRRKP